MRRCKWGRVSFKRRILAESDPMTGKEDGVRRDTAYEYVDRDDFSEELPRKRGCSKTSRAGVPSFWLSGIGGATAT